jgi:hypothetical protein
MTFHIQLSNPVTSSYIEDDNVESLGEVIEDLFQLDTEDAFICWNGISIALSYKYDISVIISDILDMLKEITSSSSGNITVNWPSNTFRAEWDIAWVDDELTCKSNWKSVSGSIESILNQHSVVTTTTTNFINEWGSLLNYLANCLTRAGVKIEHLEEAKVLAKLQPKILKSGRLYS